LQQVVRRLNYDDNWIKERGAMPAGCTDLINCSIFYNETFGFSLISQFRFWLKLLLAGSVCVCLHVRRLTIRRRRCLIYELCWPETTHLPVAGDQPTLQRRLASTRRTRNNLCLHVSQLISHAVTTIVAAEFYRLRQVLSYIIHGSLQFVAVLLLFTLSMTLVLLLVPICCCSLKVTHLDACCRQQLR